MTGIDYQRVEQELQQQVQPLPTLPLSGLHVHGWSTALLGLYLMIFRLGFFVLIIKKILYKLSKKSLTSEISDCEK